MKKYVLFTLLITSVTGVVMAESIELLPGQIFVSETDIGKYTCGYMESKWVPGTLKKDGKTFEPFSSQLNKLKLKLKLASSSKKNSIKAKISLLKNKNKKGSKACKEGINLPVYTPTVSTPANKQTATPNSTIPGILPPKNTPTRTPTPIQSIGQNNFDANGNVTNQGKIAFSIPSNLSANIDSGKIVHQDNSCSGCHAEKTNFSFTKLKNALPKDPMFIFLNDQKLADLTAYLNRFRP